MMYGYVITSMVRNDTIYQGFDTVSVLCGYLYRVHGDSSGFPHAGASKVRAAVMEGRSA